MPKHAFKLQRPKFRPTVVRAAMLHVVSLAKYAATCTPSWVPDSHSHNAACQSDRVFHAQSGEIWRGKVQSVVVKCRHKRHPRRAD